METITLTRQQLYDLVWKESLSSISMKYVISFDELKKFCKNNDIPIPQKDYWCKLKFNNLLRLFNKDLDLIIKNGKNKSKLIITANGNPYLFKEVELLVLHAPVIDRWEITAFLQPENNLTKYVEGTDKPLEYYGISLRISEMYFRTLENPKKPTDLGLKIYLRNYIVHKNNPQLREAVYVHIEHLIGEKSFANEIAFIEIDQLTNCPDDVIELYNLKSFIESLYKINFRQ